ncbi:unnamed protein product [Ectocarpus sp. CCAP 1310/34]|nr:unnamed protein product [Ectocarpus sp. CCAP 1310/34]
MTAATGDRKRRKDVRPGEFLASPPLLLLSLLLASAPDRGGSFLYPTGRSGSCDGGGATTLTASRDRRGGGRYNFARGRVGGVVAINDGGTAMKTGGGGEGGGVGGGGLAGAKRGRGSSSMGMPSDEWRGALGAKAEISARRGSLTSLASKSVGMAAAAAAAAGVPHDKAEGAGDGGPKHGDDRSVSAVEERGVEERVPTAGELLVMARELYDEIFGPPEDVRHVCAGYAPGRVNLIGEHTDYQGGFVLPLALERGTVVYGVGRLVDSGEATAEGSDRGLCRVVSQTMQQQQSEDKAGRKAGELGGDVSFRADESLAPGEPEWANYVKGVVKEYMPKVPEGKRLEFTVTVVRSVPIGGGVSSSASLSVAVASFLQGVLTSAGVTPPSPKEKAHLCRMAEHKFLNMPCGIMDQFVTSMAVPGHAMLLDCRSEEPDAVPLSDSNLVVVVTNSNVKHNLAGSQYPIRVAQCQAARDELQKSHPDVQLLRDATPEQVDAIEAGVEDAVFRRARHVVSENARTVTAARALTSGDYQEVGQLMLDSHRSLREDYEVSCPELDVLVELAMEVEGVFGSRLTGGGFGGCTVTLAKKGSVASLVQHLREGYLRAVGRDCSSFVTKPGFGSRSLTGEAAATGTAWPE